MRSFPVWPQLLYCKAPNLSDGTHVENSETFFLLSFFYAVGKLQSPTCSVVAVVGATVAVAVSKVAVAAAADIAVVAARLVVGASNLSD